MFYDQSQSVINAKLAAFLLVKIVINDDSEICEKYMNKEQIMDACKPLLICAEK